MPQPTRKSTESASYTCRRSDRAGARPPAEGWSRAILAALRL
jgi:hypothetical protein